MDDIVAKRDQQTQQLYEQLADCPVVEVTGIVGASGIGGGKSGDEELWELWAMFDAWRIDSGPLRTEPIRIRRKVSDKELSALQLVMNEDTVVRIRARVSEENILGSPQALLEECIGADSSDAELNEYLARLLEPVVYEDSYFGTLTFDRRTEEYTCEVVWNGQSVTLTLSVEENNNPDSALNAARVLWSDSLLWDTRIRDYAVQELLPVKNNYWIDEGEDEVSADQFKSSMVLETIAIRPDGSFEFWHDDGDLFWGHAIQVCGNLSGEFTRADIPG